MLLSPGSRFSRLGSCFFRPRWCFCCHVYAFSVHPDAVVTRFMIFPSTLMFLLPCSCFFRCADAFVTSFKLLRSRLGWSFCCQVHAFSIHVDAFVARFMLSSSTQILLLPGSWFFHAGWCFCCHFHVFPVHAGAFVAMFMFFLSTLRRCFRWQVHVFCLHANAFSIHVGLILLLPRSFFASTLGWCFCCLFLFQLKLFLKGNIQRIIGIQFMFLFVLVTHYYMDVEFIIQFLFIFHFSILFIFWMFEIRWGKASWLESWRDILCYLFFILFNSCYMKFNGY